MARGFGGVRGASNTTDKVVTSLTSTSSTRTYFLWVNRDVDTGPSGSGYQTMWSKGNTSTEALYKVDGIAQYRFTRQFSASNYSYWYISAPSIDTWHAIGVSYDSSSTSNNPVMYVDGSSVTVTGPDIAPSGTALTDSENYVCGNNASNNNRTWGGDLYGFAVWDAILTADEHAQLAAGVSPMLIRPNALVEYIDMEQEVFSWVRAAPTTTGTAFQATPVGQIPHVSDIYNITAGAGGGTTKTVTITLVTSPTDATVRANLTGLKYAFFDNVTPDLFSAPTDKGTGETTDGSGVLQVSVPNSTKTNGQVGFLIVTDSDGTTTQSPAHKAFAGPVTVTVT